jgi:hypothetical protein
MTTYKFNVGDKIETLEEALEFDLECVRHGGWGRAPNEDAWPDDVIQSKCFKEYKRAVVVHLSDHPLKILKTPWPEPAKPETTTELKVALGWDKVRLVYPDGFPVEDMFNDSPNTDSKFIRYRWEGGWSIRERFELQECLTAGGKLERVE